MNKKHFSFNGKSICKTQSLSLYPVQLTENRKEVNCQYCLDWLNNKIKQDDKGPKHSVYNKRTQAMIKLDNNKYKAKLGWNIDLMDMIKKGLIEITGEQKGTGELIYGITPAGKKYLEEFGGKQ